MDGLISELAFLLQRLDWAAVLDLILVAAIVFSLLQLARGTQAVVLLRGLILLVAIIALLTALLPLAAFSWLLRAALPALIIAIPVIFAPEIRRALERLGRASSVIGAPAEPSHLERWVEAVANASQRLSDTRQGALIVIERETPLDEYIETGVLLDAVLTPELLLQIFYVNTPLHDGAVIIRRQRLVAAGCVMPLSASGTLSRSPERHMGLRHRAALGISEVSDAVAVVVSEETGGISVAHKGRMIRRLDLNRLRNILIAFHRPRRRGWMPDWLDQLGEQARQRRLARRKE
ncbi:MAG: diadenylate cyclase CdaA [Anaerolineales bacterium]|nr:diadenylate cyclase CdaA [Anaerolineales bacterium]